MAHWKFKISSESQSIASKHKNLTKGEAKLKKQEECMSKNYQSYKLIYAWLSTQLPIFNINDLDNWESRFLLLI